jgi:hypothetical protein
VKSLAVGVIAAVWSATFMIANGYQEFPPGGEEARIGIHIANGDGFRSPMDSQPTAPPTAWSPPVYPLIIGAAYRAFGIESERAIIILLLINACCFGAIAAAVHRLGVIIFRSHIPGLITAGLISVHPYFTYYMGNLWDGIVSLAMFLWLVVAAMEVGSRARRGQAASGRWAAALGAGMGLLALTNTTYCLTYPVLLLVACPHPLQRRHLRFIATTGFIFVLTITPWTIRNYAVFGRLVFVRTSPGIAFWVSNQPGSSGWLDANAIATHPFANRDEGALLLRVGEPAYDTIVRDRFRQLLKSDPWAFVQRCVRRAGYLVAGGPIPPGTMRARVLNLVVAALALAGVVAARRLGYRQHQLPTLMLLLALPYIPTLTGDRYALPLRCLLVFYAGAMMWMAARMARTPAAFVASDASGAVR